MKNPQKLFVCFITVSILFSSMGCSPKEALSEAGNSQPSIQEQEVSTSSETLEIPIEQREVFTVYFNDFIRFFHDPVSGPDALLRDQNFAWFLLYETYQQGTAAGQTYPQNDNQLYEIPNSEISETAEKLLGITAFRPEDIPEWPFSDGTEGDYQLFSAETELPYCECVTRYTEWTDEIVTAETVLNDDPAKEGQADAVFERYFEFRRMEDEEGEYYQLQSIAEKD